MTYTLQLAKIRERSALRSLAAANLVALWLVGLGGAPGRAAERDVIDVTSRKQLFIDNRFIAHAERITLRQQAPDLQRENLLKPEHPWESGSVITMGSILQHEGKVRLWYYPAAWKAPTSLKMCYAESEDGVHFTKPLAGVVEYEGSEANNIVLPGGSGAVFLDLHDDPARPYKAIIDMRPEFMGGLTHPETVGTGKHWNYLFSSADGIRWQRSPKIVFPMYLGHLQSVIWDDRLGKWVAYLRGHRPQRWFGRVEVERGRLGEPYPFTPLSGVSYDPPGVVELTRELPTALDRDEKDKPGAQPYTMNAWKYPLAQDAYFAFVPMWYDSRHGNSGASDRVEVQLAVSRDGVRWERPWRMPLISPGAPSLRGSGQIWPLQDPIIRDGEIWLYYLSEPTSHLGLRTKPNYVSPGEAPFYAEPKPNTDMFARAIWPIDRLVGAEADAEGGFILTPSIRFRGSTLVVNADCGASGNLVVSVERPDGSPFPGLAAADSTPIQGNGLALPVTWKGAGNSLARLAGAPVRLRFRLTAAKLYSFQFR